MKGYITRALGRDTRCACAALGERRNGVRGGCRWLVLPSGTQGGSRDGRRARKNAMVVAGTPHTGPVCGGDAAVGRAQSGARDGLSEIRSRRADDARRPREDTPPVGRISWFVTDKRCRRQGFAATAIGGAAAEIARAGRGMGAACPEALEGQNTAAGFLRRGIPGLFDRAGFSPVRKIGKHRRVVRRNVEGTMR